MSTLIGPGRFKSSVLLLPYKVKVQLALGVISYVLLPERFPVPEILNLYSDGGAGSGGVGVIVGVIIGEGAGVPRLPSGPVGVGDGVTVCEEIGVGVSVGVGVGVSVGVPVTAGETVAVTVGVGVMGRFVKKVAIPPDKLESSFGPPRLPTPNSGLPSPFKSHVPPILGLSEIEMPSPS